MAVSVGFSLPCVFMLVNILMLCTGQFADGCEDRLTNCQAYDESFCGIYPLWALENCARTCQACLCPEGWKHYSPDDTCLKVFGNDESDQQLDWDQARKACQNVSADLVQIHDMNKNIFTVGMMGNSDDQEQSQMWIGVKNHGQGDKEFLFNYVDGTPLKRTSSFPNWVPNNPDNYEGSEKCVSMYPPGDYSGKWNDLSCAIPHPYMCSKLARTSALL